MLTPDGVPDTGASVETTLEDAASTIPASTTPTSAPVVDDGGDNNEPPVDTTPEAPETTDDGDDSESTVDINDFLNITGRDHIKSAEHKPDTTPGDKTAKVDVKPSTTPDNKKVTPKEERDFTGLAEDEKPLFKEMSKESFNKFKPIFLENKKLKEDYAKTNKELEDAKKGIVRIPDSYYSHENAFMLTPEFGKIAKDIQFASQVENHWRAQLKAMREGAKTISMIQANPQGQIVKTGDIPVDDNTEDTLREFIDHGKQLNARAAARLEGLQQSYGSRYADATTKLQQFENETFAALTADDEKKATYEPLIQQYMEKIPSEYRNNPVASLAAKALTMTHALLIALNNVKTQQEAAINGNGKGKGKGKTATSVAKAPKAQPTAAEINADGNDGGTTKDEDNVTFEDFEKLKAGY